MLEVFAFLAGIHVMMMLIASIYGFVDLWYRIGDFWLQVTARVVFVVAINLLLTWILDGEIRLAFLWGQGFYLVFHIVVFWFARLGIWILDIKRS